jgi:hypothetical protein
VHVILRPEEGIRAREHAQEDHPGRPDVHGGRLVLGLEQHLGRPKTGRAGASHLLMGPNVVAARAVGRLAKAQALVHFEHGRRGGLEPVGHAPPPSVHGRHRALLCEVAPVGVRLARRKAGLHPRGVVAGRGYARRRVQHREARRLLERGGSTAWKRR